MIQKRNEKNNQRFEKITKEQKKKKVQEFQKKAAVVSSVAFTTVKTSEDKIKI